jgi:3-hydroxyacyl-[acyl-carrier-protein] dehydratase
MSFSLIDRIVAVTPGESIEALKSLTTAEGYLHDHFPRFPVMPGVMMLEAMFQASAWLVRVTDDFTLPAVLMRQARNIKYADFVQPAQQLVLTATIQKREENIFTLKTQGQVAGRVAVSGRLIVEIGELPEKAASRKSLVPMEMEKIRIQYNLLYKPNTEVVAAL